MSDLESQLSETSEKSESSRHLIDSLAQLKRETKDLFAYAKQSIQIYSHGLDPRVLNNRDIEQQLIRFVKKSRSCKVQILIYDEQFLRGIDHRLVSLAQRFTSYIEIKLVAKEHHDNPFGFYLVDGKSMIYRNNIERYEAEKYQMPHFAIKDKNKFFETIWQASSPASFLRALHL